MRTILSLLCFALCVCNRISSIGNGKIVKSVVNACLHDLYQIDYVLVDESNFMSSGQGNMVHGHVM